MEDSTQGGTFLGFRYLKGPLIKILFLNSCTLWLRAGNTVLDVLSLLLSITFTPRMVIKGKEYSVLK